jgi:hypothetical protein
MRTSQTRHPNQALVSKLLIHIYRGITSEGTVFGVALFIVGTIIWQLKHVRGIGDGIISVSIVILLYKCLVWAQRTVLKRGDRVSEFVLKINYKIRDWL